jgi:CBS domain containing-hemolysin-like protein
MEYLSFNILFLFLLILLLFLLSLLDAAVSHLTQVQLKVLAEQDKKSRTETILRRLADNPLQVQLHLRIGSQFIIVVVAILITFISLQHLERLALFWAFVFTGGILMLVRHVLPHLAVYRKPDQYILFLLPILKSFYFLTRPFLLPLFSSWERSEIKDKEDDKDGDEEDDVEEEVAERNAFAHAVELQVEDAAGLGVVATEADRVAHA